MHSLSRRNPQSNTRRPVYPLWCWNISHQWPHRMCCQLYLFARWHNEVCCTIESPPPSPLPVNSFTYYVADMTYLCLKETLLGGQSWIAAIKITTSAYVRKMTCATGTMQLFTLTRAKKLPILIRAKILAICWIGISSFNYWQIRGLPLFFFFFCFFLWYVQFLRRHVGIQSPMQHWRSTKQT